MKLIRRRKILTCLLLLIIVILITYLKNTDDTQLVYTETKDYISANKVDCGVERLLASAHRPKFVRFKWYFQNGGPQIEGYSGPSAVEVFKPLNFVQTDNDDWDLLWSMVPQWDHFPNGVPKKWQVHNHCFNLANFKGISGDKISQWEKFICMQNKFGKEVINYMPDSFIPPHQYNQFPKRIDKEES